jgi:hypothetical protein
MEKFPVFFGEIIATHFRVLLWFSGIGGRFSDGSTPRSFAFEGIHVCLIALKQ